MEKILTYNDSDFVEGERVVAKIKGSICEGIITKQGGSLFLCQNIRAGNRPANLYGYKFGWTFERKTPNELSEGVELIKDPSGEILETMASIKVDTKIRDGVTVTTLKIDDFKLSFSIRQYPSCCGASIIHAISVMYLKTLEEKYIDHILSFIQTYPLISAILVVDSTAHKFFIDRLGFTPGVIWYNTHDSGARLQLLTKVKETAKYD